MPPKKESAPPKQTLSGASIARKDSVGNSQIPIPEKDPDVTLGPEDGAKANDSENQVVTEDPMTTLLNRLLANQERQC